MKKLNHCLKMNFVQLSSFFGVFVLSLFFIASSYGQGTLPWVEDFDLPDNTTSDVGETAWSAERADGLTFWVIGGQFVVNDDNDNDPVGTLTTGIIDISTAQSVTASLDVSTSSGLDGGQDFVKLWAVIDGGDPVLLDSIDAYTHKGTEYAAGEVVTLRGGGITGSTLQLLVTSYVSFNSEFYYLDYLSVKEKFDWVEDFDLPDNTQVDNGPTAWTAERGDALPFWVVGGQFVINDDNGNDPVGTLTTEVLDISAAASVSISLDVSASDGLDDGQDYVKLYAVVDGGDPMILDSIDAYNHKGIDIDVGEVATLMGGGISGSTLQIIVKAWLSAGSEFYYLDNLSVTEQFAWVEDFDLPDNTQLDDGPTAWTAERADAMPFWVVGGQFVINDDNENDPVGTLTTEVLDISLAEKIMVTLDVSTSSGLDNGQDYVKLWAIIDGGDPVILDSIDAYTVQGKTYAEGEVVTLTGRGITGKTLQVVVTAYLSAGSEFYYMDNLSVKLETVQTYELTTSATGGSILLDPPGGIYEVGTEVTLTAIPDEGYYFDGWGGDLAGVDTAIVTVTMDSAINVSIDFAVSPTFTITTTVSNGNIVLSPPGGTYFEGTSVVVHAKPFVGFEFVEWTGDLTGSENPTTIIMDADKAITAVIEEIEAYTLSVGGTNGTVTVSPVKDVYGPGEAVILNAIADDLYRFKNWEGDLTGTENPTAIFMNGNYTITAVFELIPPSYMLTVEESENGSITIDPPGGTYDEGTVVTLTAVPDEGYAFAEWGGDASGSENPATITIDADKTVSAVFTDATGIDPFNAPSQSVLMENYPNPFSEITTIAYQLKEASNVRLSIFNILGEQITTLVDDHQAAGYYSMEWNVTENKGHALENSVYIIRMEIGDSSVQFRKAILSR